jgi:hypothetical protein
LKARRTGGELNLNGGRLFRCRPLVAEWMGRYGRELNAHTCAAHLSVGIGRSRARDARPLAHQVKQIAAVRLHRAYRECTCYCCVKAGEITAGETIVRSAYLGDKKCRAAQLFRQPKVLAAQSTG